MKFIKLFISNRKALIGLLIFLVMVLLSIFAPLIAPYSPTEMSFQALLPPNKQHLLGTTAVGQDIFSQIIWGSRLSLFVALVTGAITTLVSVIVGFTAGYFGGIVDDILMGITNIFLVIPGLPLAIIIASYVIVKGVSTIILVISLTGWAWGARVFRSQVLSLKNREFIKASFLTGENHFRIIFAHIFPNMLGIVVANFFGSAMYAVLSEAGLEFLGLGDTTAVSWGTILYWAQNSYAPYYGLWAWLLVPGIMIALLGTSFALMNFAIDEIVNPKLRRR